jgi:4'-phosphopantetheinyl transferase
MLIVPPTQIWLTTTAAASRPGRREQYLSLLSPDEHARLARLPHESARCEYLVTRTLVRTVLSRYATVSPHEWRFATNRYGRPEVPGLDLSFNLTHSDGWIACAVDSESRVGIDLERVRDTGVELRLARRFFAERELAQVLAMPALFWCFWVLKEAHTKALGSGLNTPLRDFSFEIDLDGRRVQLDAARGPWDCCVLAPHEQLLMALVRERGGGVETWVGEPLGGFDAVPMRPLLSSSDAMCAQPRDESRHLAERGMAKHHEDRELHTQLLTEPHRQPQPGQ